MTRKARGSIWWLEEPELGRKRYLIVSSNLINETLPDLVTVRLTSAQRNRTLDTDVFLEPGEVDGLTRPTWVLCHELELHEATYFVERIGLLPIVYMVRVEKAIRRALDL